jgi:hypothetical protein
MCYAYSLLIERLQRNGKFKQFPSIERLVQTIVSMLSESSAEVRNTAKVCVFKLQSAC